VGIQRKSPPISSRTAAAQHGGQVSSAEPLEATKHEIKDMPEAHDAETLKQVLGSLESSKATRPHSNAPMLTVAPAPRRRRPVASRQDLRGGRTHQTW